MLLPLDLGLAEKPLEKRLLLHLLIYHKVSPGH